MDALFNAVGYAAGSASPDPNNFRGSLPIGGGELTALPGAGPAVDLSSRAGREDPARLHGGYARALAGQEETAGRLAGLRGVDRQLELTGTKLGEAESKLVGIVKQYPPYAKDNPDRIDILNQITGLRKQIEALSIPPKKLSEQEQELAKKIGFDAPDPVNASDRDIAAALDQVKQAQSGLAELRTSMWADVVEANSAESEQDAVKYARQGQEHLAQSAKSITLSQDVIASLG